MVERMTLAMQSVAAGPIANQAGRPRMNSMTPPAGRRFSPEARRPQLEDARHLGAFIFVFLLAVNLLFFSGRFHSIDEMSLLATTESVVKWQRTDINSIAWAQWFLRGPDQQGQFNHAGDLFSKKAPLVSWILLPVYAMAGLLHARQVQAAHLLNTVVVALTAARLFGLARRMGYDSRVGLCGALLFGLGTSALVYARHLFSEPLAGLGLLLAAEGVWSYRHQRESLRPLVMAGIGLGGAVLCNPIYLLLTPIFLAALFRPPWTSAGNVKAAGAVLWPLGLALAALGLWNMGRFGSPWISGYHWEAGEGFSSPLWVSLPGMLLSPARGLLWFVPASVLSVAGAPRSLRRHRGLSLLTLSVIAAHLLLFGAWWMWWSGWGWGTRFLVPIAPFLVLLALPILEAALSSRRWLRAGVLLVCTLSVAVQILGAAVGFDEYEMVQTRAHLVGGHEGALYPYGMAGLWSWSYSPILANARLFGSGLIDLAWRSGHRTDWFLLLPLAGWITVAGWALGAGLREGALTRRWRDALLAGTAVFLVFSLWRAGQHPLRASYGVDPTAGSSALQMIAANARPGDGALLVRSLTPTEMDRFPRFPRAYGVPDGTLLRAGWDTDLERLLANSLKRQDRLWVVVRSEADPVALGIESRLRSEMRRASDWTRIDGYAVMLFSR